MNKYILIILMLQAFCFQIRAQTKPTLKGRVVDAQNQPLPNVTLKIGAQTLGVTNKDGQFTVSTTLAKGILTFSAMGYQTQTLAFEGNKSDILIQLKEESAALREVQVVSTGYQTLPKERATGSFVLVDSALLNRRVGANIIDRLEGVTSGLLFNKNAINVSSSALTIRGLSTINANKNPLIVVDNFPYHGDISSINPNDIANISILKDAAAASIWGAFSGNGVIVITTKKGALHSRTKVQVNSNVTLGDRPNLYYAPRLSAASYIGVEQFLFEKGYYDRSLTRISKPVVSPIVEILAKQRGGAIDGSQAQQLLDAYASQDTRHELAKYMYRRSLAQQYSMNISGGGNQSSYYVSVGYDGNLANLNRNNSSRISIVASNTASFLDKKIALSTSLYLTKNSFENNGMATVAPYPYLNLKNADGTAAVVPNKFRQTYVDTVGGGALLDWRYRPLDELELNDQTQQLDEHRLNTKLQYNITAHLNASVQYQYTSLGANQRLLNSSESFYTRDYINQFTQYDAATGTYTRPVPLGGILDRSYQQTTAHNGRAQFNYSQNFGQHSLNAVAGFEVRNVAGNSNSYRIYGHNDLGSTAAVDYRGDYVLMPSTNRASIASNLSQLGTLNRFVSYYTNAAYTFKNRYTLSASARKDASNLFGVATNQRAVPLWSAGASWELHKEDFFKLSAISYLRLRATTGYQGNVDPSLSSLITANVTGAVNRFSQPVSFLSNPPNAQLRWEKIRTTNFAVDFATKPIKGNIEFFLKKGTDLIGTSPVDPTTGVMVFKGNTANMRGKGMDVTLNTTNLSGSLKWTSDVLLSWATDKVTKYLLKPNTVADALAGFNPIEGNPVYSLYAFKWAGLDTEGNPQVYANDRVSKEYAQVYNSSNLNNLVYQGPLNPVWFGAFKNDFQYKGLLLSINISYKFGYFFRRQSINYNSLFSGSAYMPEADYLNRWQVPGDEAFTQVPSMVYPLNTQRDLIYQYSTELVERGDHIRLQDIQLRYDFNQQNWKRMPFKNMGIYAYVNNLGILWRANKRNLDPDYLPTGAMVFPNVKTYAIGIKLGL